MYLGFPCKAGFSYDHLRDGYPRSNMATIPALMGKNMGTSLESMKQHMEFLAGKINGLPSGFSTWPWKMAHLYMVYLLNMVIFHGYVK